MTSGLPQSLSPYFSPSLSLSDTLQCELAVWLWEVVFWMMYKLLHELHGFLLVSNYFGLSLDFQNWDSVDLLHLFTRHPMSTRNTYLTPSSVGYVINNLWFTNYLNKINWDTHSTASSAKRCRGVVCHLVAAAEPACYPCGLTSCALIGEVMSNHNERKKQPKGFYVQSISQADIISELVWYRYRLSFSESFQATVCQTRAPLAQLVSSIIFLSLGSSQSLATSFPLTWTWSYVVCPPPLLSLSLTLCRWHLITRRASQSLMSLCHYNRTRWQTDTGMLTTGPCFTSHTINGVFMPVCMPSHAHTQVYSTSKEYVLWSDIIR